jgi:PIN domain nuclease of toxin-antitoxin system
LLVDTGCWLWSLTEPERLNEHARALLADRSNTILLSAASAWEIAIKAALGKLPLPEPPDTYVPSRIAAQGLTPLPILQTHALRTHGLPPIHRDPFDRLLVAQAQLESLSILTADRVFSGYDVEVVWGSG